MKNLLDIQDLHQSDHLELIARQVVEGFIIGLHRSPYHGFSVEFAEHRHYNDGESTKHIDWKLYGKTEKLFVKKFEEETNLRTQIIIDNSSSMYFPFQKKSLNNKLFFSVYSAASLIHLMRKQRDAVGLSLFTDKLDLHTPSRLSEVHAQGLFNELRKLISEYLDSKFTKAPAQKTDISGILHQLAETLHRRSLVILFSDFFDQENPEGVFQALQHLKYNKHELILFHVKDPRFEEAFNYSNRPHRFVDLETGESIKLNPHDVKEGFIEKSRSFKKSLKEKCDQYRIDLIEANITENFGEVLNHYLIKRSQLH